MSMFSICTSFITEGKLPDTIKELKAAEKNFSSETGVIFRKFFQCEAQPHIIWTITEWESEKHHNDAAQSIMKTRRDDRISSILFGPEPYFEIFCDEETKLNIGIYSDKFKLIVVAHGLIGTKVKEQYLKLQNERIKNVIDKIDWLRVYHNRYNTDEFVAFMGFSDEGKFNSVRMVENFCIEEYLFTGLREPFGMSYIANYNQYICTPMSMEGN